MECSALLDHMPAHSHATMMSLGSEEADSTAELASMNQPTPQPAPQNVLSGSSTPHLNLLLPQ